MIVLLPTILIIRQPDLGTAILVTGTGLFVIFLAGISYRLIVMIAWIDDGCRTDILELFIT